MEEKEEDDTFTVDGYVDGPSLGSTQDGARFIIKKTYGERPEKFVTIQKIEALPSYSQWIAYKLQLRKPTKGSIYSVVRVLGCTSRRVHKDELVEHIVTARKWEKKMVKSKLQKVGIQILSLEEIDRDVEDQRMKTLLYALLKVAFKPQIYYDMLRYFSSTFLMKFTDEQLISMATVAVYAPYTFCFWDHTKRILSNLVVEGKKVFDSEEDDLYMDDSYAYTIGDVLLKREGMKRISRYSSKFPVWSLDAAEMGCTQWLNDDMFECIDTTLKMALAIYLEMDKTFYVYGNTCFSLRRIKQDRLKDVDKAIEFMIREGIVKFALGDSSRKDILIKPHNELVEVNIAAKMEEKFKGVKTVDCPSYGVTYVKIFVNWVHTSQNVWDTPLDRILFVSANSMTATYMKKATGLEFMSLDDVEKKHFINKDCIVMDKAQKVSVLGFRDLMKRARPGMTMCVLGDMTDYYVNSKRGGGDIYGPLIERFAPERWYRWDQKDPMKMTYDCFTNPSGIILASIHPIPLDKPKVLLDHIKSLGDKSSTGSLSYNIFCGNENDKIELMEIVCKKIGGNECTFDKHCFMMGQKIHVYEDDYCGILESAADEREPRVKLNVKEINTLKGRYILEIGGRKYSTSHKALKHADVSVISRFHGAPAEYGVFYVTPETNRKHLWCAAKYCTKELTIFVKPGMNIGDVKQPIQIRPANDLYSKLKRMSIK